MSAAVAAVLAAAAPGSARASDRLETAIMPLGTGTPQTYDRIRRTTGATSVRLVLTWAAVAPRAVTKPADFDAADQTDPAYRWASFDREVTLATQRGLQPIVTLYNAPSWAEGAANGLPGMRRPNTSELGLFAKAAAERYSGRNPGLPRVRHWQVWNEPNLTHHLAPQFEPQLTRGGRPTSPALYREMVNEVARAVKSVRADNLVIAGGLSPFRDIVVDHYNGVKWGPLGFMRELFCLSPRLTRTCRNPVQFDIWSHHPYTSGAPTRKAQLPDDVSIGDLPVMRRTLDAAVRAGNVRSRGPVRFWVTEFSWDTSPPDPQGVPMRVHTRWVAEALYRMWQNDVSLVTWFSLHDQPMSTSVFQSGLYFAGNRAKPSLGAFRFPFVAFPQRGGRVHVWGRTPAGRTGSVVVEQQFRGGWRRLGIVRTNPHGIFQARLPGAATGYVRARTLTGARAVPFAMRPPPDRYYAPFGTQHLVRP